MSYNISSYIQSPINAVASDLSFLLFSQTASQIVQLFGVIDAIPEEQHHLSAGTTEYAIETGATLTDHVYIKPKELTITGYVSKILVSTVTTLVTTLRDREAWERLLLQINDRSLVTVVTTLSVYENMVITDIQANKNQDVGSGNLIFTMSLKEALIANTQTTSLPSSQLTGDAANRSGTVNGGARQSSGESIDNYQSWLSSVL